MLKFFSLSLKYLKAEIDDRSKTKYFGHLIEFFELKCRHCLILIDLLSDFFGKTLQCYEHYSFYFYRLLTFLSSIRKGIRVFLTSPNSMISIYFSFDNTEIILSCLNFKRTHTNSDMNKVSKYVHLYERK